MTNLSMLIRRFRIEILALMLCGLIIEPRSIVLAQETQAPRSATTTQNDQSSSSSSFDVTVRLSIIVGKNGKPGKIKVVRSAGSEWDKQAMEAASKYQFRPSSQSVELILDVNMKSKSISTDPHVESPSQGTSK